MYHASLVLRLRATEHRPALGRLNDEASELDAFDRVPGRGLPSTCTKPQ